MIKIDMEMPESCDECPINSKYKHLCKITKKSTWSKGYGGVSLKNDDCPWVECENEKSCETCKNLYFVGSIKTCDEDCIIYSSWQAK